MRMIHVRDGSTAGSADPALARHRAALAASCRAVAIAAMLAAANPAGTGRLRLQLCSRDTSPWRVPSASGLW
jgi:hypothetical protein